MAKAKTAAAPKAKRKAVKAVKAIVRAAPKGGKKKGGKKSKGNAADTLWKLAEHPLVGELLAIGATAAVAAIAEGGSGNKKLGSSKTVQAAGKAAAAAIGARLISEFAEGAGKKAAKAVKPAKA
ncbi:MAG: hypothetical protein ACJ8E6_06850 [Sphingomicrobium sp.]